ncbi:unnamed protein product [Bursaphelenchus xylophilus]|uniref:(pine wood nematode) hypothetical protein n=1 Tax=Bursaphelenchus xylophilus TaxID=6326 RepID=A0A1I7S888_BURXY|nr:unnamed protein product [Bursaphelenchus xylophilus]CAG9080425.1 unnamed protein product [Bursaphelenchus xylophilus]
MVHTTSDKLPRNVIVHQYDLVITPFFAFKGFEFDKALLNTFKGNVKITFNPIQANNSVTLASNPEFVTIQSAVLSLDGTNIEIASNSTDSDDHLTLVTKTPLETGKNYTLHFVFNGTMVNGSNGGLFSFDYTDKDGKNTSLAATMFETIHARRVFPCFDDPFFKAVFVVTVIHPKGSQAHSNAEVDITQDLDKEVMTKFKPTLKMSPYLLAFAVGDFTERVVESKRGVKIRSLAVKIFEGSVDKAAKIGAECLDIMEDLLQVKYPMMKLDHLDTISLGAGAMENFGLVTYGNKLPLPFPLPLKMEIETAAVVCHETSHMWFGNLVTAERWGLEFLHEAFAVFFEAATLRRIDPYTFTESARVANILEYAEAFAQAPKHPVAADRSYFDEVTYGYGSAIVHSMEGVFGKDTFYKALHTYISENMYKNVDLETLLSSFERAAPSKYLCDNLTVSEYMRDYFLQAGSPLVNITYDENNRLKMKQIPFENNTLWNVPIFMKNLDTTEEFTYWLLKNGRHCVQNAKGRIDSRMPYFFNHNSRSFHYLDILKIVSDKLNPNSTAWEDRLRADSIFLDAVQAGVESAVKMAKKLFAEFTKDCAHGTEALVCEKFIPEFRCGALFEGNKTKEGRQFLLDYFQRVAENPVIASGLARYSYTCDLPLK